MRKFCVSSLLALLIPSMVQFCLANANFDPDRYLVGPFSTPVPLSSNYISDIIQTHDGCLYFSTMEGLDSYDGYELRHIKFPRECKGFDCNAALCEDDCGRIWLASYNGLAVYTPETEDVNIFRKGSVSNIVKVRNGNIFVSAQYGGYLKIKPSTMECDTLEYEYHNASAHFGSGLCYDGEDTIYYINGVGALYRSGMDATRLELIVPYERSPFSMLNISTIACMNGCIVGGLPSKTLIYNLKTGETMVRPWSNVRDALSFDGCSFLSLADGLKVVDESFNVLHSYGPVTCLCADSSGGLLFGTSSNAVCRFNPNYPRYRKYLQKEEGRGATVRSVIAREGGGMWVATQDDGLLFLDTEKNTVERVALPFRARLLSLGFVGDALMVGVHSASRPLLSVSMADMKVRELNYVPPMATAFFNLGGGKFLMGSAGRLSEVDMNTKTSRRLEKVRATVSSIFEYDGAVYAASSFNGLWSVRDGVWKHYNDSLGVSMLIQDAVALEDGIYLATANYGLQHLTSDGVVRTVENFAQVHCSRLNSIAADRNGMLWMTTSKGIAGYDTRSGRSAFFFSSELPVDSGTTLLKIYSAPDGRMYVGTSEGLFSFDPDGLVDSRGYDREIAFTSLSVLNTIGGGEKDAVRRAVKGDGPVKPVSLKASENSFTVTVSDMNYSLPRTTGIVYRLEGYSDGWTYAPSGKITVNSLRPGKYRLVVRSVDRYGNPTGRENSMNIAVQRPLGLSVPAISLYILLLVGAVTAIVLYLQRKAVREANEAAMLSSQKRDAENQKKLYTSKIEFLLGIAHDIRTPLSLVRAPIETLQEKLKGIRDPSVLEDLETIGRNSEILAGMMDDLLDFKKLENSGYRLKPANEDVVKIVENCCRRFQISARTKKRSFMFTLPHNPIVAAIDRNVLDKIIANLLSNAVKYSASRIVLKLERGEDESFSVIVENDGPVVPPEFRERIFLPFERYVEDGSTVSGTGIGLFISRNFAQLHGGNLAMDGDRNLNRFILNIPLKHVDLAPDVSAIPEFNVEKQNLTILLVEDNDELRHFVARQFEGRFTVMQASDGNRAWAMLENMEGGLPDIVVSDVMMPGMDGYQLCRKIKSDDRMMLIPVILLTARADVESKVMGWEFGADSYVSKPFSAVELVAQVSGMIENRRRLKERFLHSGDAEREELSGASPHTLFLRKADQFISGNVGKENISVEDLAAACCMSESSLFKKMKGLLGIGPGEYILLFRLKQAARMLKNTSMPIADISAAVGFRSHSTFSTAFKKQFGVSPKEYRDK